MIRLLGDDGSVAFTVPSRPRREALVLLLSQQASRIEGITRFQTGQGT